MLYMTNRFANPARPRIFKPRCAQQQTHCSWRNAFPIGRSKARNFMQSWTEWPTSEIIQFSCGKPDARTRYATYGKRTVDAIVDIAESVPLPPFEGKTQI